MASSRSRSPPPKRVKLESPTTVFVKSEPLDESRLLEPEELEAEGDDDDDDGERCSICLQEVVDRTVVPVCAHEFCFDCLIVWADQSRRCPLCSQGIGTFLIHKIRSRYDYQKHYLNPLRTSPVPLQTLPPRRNRVPRRRQRESREWGRRERTEEDEADKLDRSIAKRRWIYEHNLYAKHVASNAYTRYRPYPTPAQFAASPDLISRTTMFLRRELQVWVNLDVEFLTTFIISIMKAIDIRSESAVKLLSEFLDLDTPYVEGGRHMNAEHFAHEVYSYVRSPYKDLFVYDSVVQYEVTPDLPPPTEEPRRRWRDAASRSRSPVDSGSARDVRAEGSRRAPDARRMRSGSSRSLSSSESRSRRRTSSRDRQLDAHTSRGSGSGRRQSRNASRHRESDDPSNSNTGVKKFDMGIGAGQTRIQHNAPERTPPAPDATTETTDSLHDKGNTRVDVDIPGPALSEEDICIPGGAPESIIPPPAEAPRKPPRAPRNRSLFESVQAHLAVPARKQQQRETNSVVDSTSTLKPSATATFVGGSKEDTTGSVPSLLTRLSDPSTRRPIYDLPVGRHSLDGTTCVAEVVEGASSEIAIERPDSHRKQHSFSTPEIMARTRARLAKLAANDAQPPACQNSISISAPLDGGASAGSSSSAPLSLSLGSGQDGNRDISTAAENTAGTDSPRRTRLLGRLEEEKQKAAARDVSVTQSASSVAVDDDRISQAEAEFQHSRSPIAFPPDTPSEGADVAEARLRRQAQLRVRLAAEKRRHASSGIQ